MFSTTAENGCVCPPPSCVEAPISLNYTTGFMLTSPLITCLRASSWLYLFRNINEPLKCKIPLFITFHFLKQSHRHRCFHKANSIAIFKCPLCIFFKPASDFKKKCGSIFNPSSCPSKSHCTHCRHKG